ncbi:hypothetical protein BT93_E2369 [Corymbia citriodora subsp. variegata]|nr:hypothetical protein BT93_E2369 [Corymbia citriodora subsp. variegata]
MNPTTPFIHCCRVLCYCCYVGVTFCVIPILISAGIHELFNWLSDKLKGTSRAVVYWIGIIAATCVLLFSMKLMYVFTKYIRDCFADAPDNQDQRHGFDHAPTQDNPQRGIETLDRTRRPGEEERKQILQDLFKVFPSVSYTSRNIRSESGDCAICLGEFVEGELCWVLPACKHMFHSSCIDRWLMTRFSCPVCRNSVLPV